MKKVISFIIVGFVFTVFTTSAIAETSSSTSSCPFLFQDMTIGSTDASTDLQVGALQTFLKAQGYYNDDITGYFGSLTRAAVASYQADNGIKPSDGFVGPLTRAFINSKACLPGAMDTKSINVTSPNGGETFTLGAKNSNGRDFSVTWKSKNLKGDVYVYLDPENGDGTCYIGKEKVSKGSYSVFLGANHKCTDSSLAEITNGNYKVILYSEKPDGTKNYVKDFSDSYFLINNYGGTGILLNKIQGIGVYGENKIKPGGTGRVFGNFDAFEKGYKVVFTRGSIKKSVSAGQDFDDVLTFTAPDKLATGLNTVYVSNGNVKSNTILVDVAPDFPVYSTSTTATSTNNELPTKSDGVVYKLFPVAPKQYLDMSGGVVLYRYSLTAPKQNNVDLKGEVIELNKTNVAFDNVILKVSTNNGFSKIVQQKTVTDSSANTGKTSLTFDFDQAYRVAAGKTVYLEVVANVKNTVRDISSVTVSRKPLGSVITSTQQANSKPLSVNLVKSTTRYNSAGEGIVDLYAKANPQNDRVKTWQIGTSCAAGVATYDIDDIAGVDPTKNVCGKTKDVQGYYTTSSIDITAYDKVVMVAKMKNSNSKAASVVFTLSAIGFDGKKLGTQSATVSVNPFKTSNSASSSIAEEFFISRLTAPGVSKDNQARIGSKATVYGSFDAFADGYKVVMQKGSATRSFAGTKGFDKTLDFQLPSDLAVGTYNLHVERDGKKTGNISVQIIAAAAQTSTGSVGTSTTTTTTATTTAPASIKVAVKTSLPKGESGYTNGEVIVTGSASNKWVSYWTTTVTCSPKISAYEYGKSDRVTSLNTSVCGKAIKTTASDLAGVSTASDFMVSHFELKNTNVVPPPPPPGVVPPPPPPQTVTFAVRAYNSAGKLLGADSEIRTIPITPK